MAVHVKMALRNHHATRRRVKRIIRPSVMRMPMVVVFVVVRVAGAMRMAMAGGLTPLLLPRSYRDPKTEGNQSYARGDVDDVSEPLSCGYADQPHGEAKNQGCRRVTRAGLQGGPGGFPLRPAALSCQQSDRRPVVRHRGVQDADTDHPCYQQQFLCVQHWSSPLIVGLATMPDLPPCEKRHQTDPSAAGYVVAGPSRGGGRSVSARNSSLRASSVLHP